MTTTEPGDDIVERLRNRYTKDVTPALLDEAADLIAALRDSHHAAIKAITAYTEACIDLNNRLNAAEAENGQLREDNATLAEQLGVASLDEAAGETPLAAVVSLLEKDGHQ